VGRMTDATGTVGIPTEVKTIRRKITTLAATGRADELLAAMARRPRRRAPVQTQDPTQRVRVDPGGAFGAGLPGQGLAKARNTPAMSRVSSP
jgi:hypothetical protein